MTATIHLDSVSTAYRPDEPIMGSVEWSGATPSRDLELRLLYHTSGIGTQDVETVATTVFESAAATESRRFELKIPGDSPWSFSGKLVSLLWSLELVTSDDTLVTSKALVISPTGSEIDLYAHSEANVE